MQAEPSIRPRVALAVLALCGAAGALAVWLARPIDPTPARERGQRAFAPREGRTQPSAGLVHVHPPPPPPTAASHVHAAMDREQLRAEANDAPNATQAAAPRVRKVSEALRVRFASPSAAATAPGVRASQAACARLLTRVQRGDALDPGEQLTWQRVCSRP